MITLKRYLLTVLALLLAACAAGPEPIRWGTDACDRCRMILTDRAFGVELVAKNGKVYKFDGIDELGHYLAAEPAADGTVLVTNGRDGELIPAQQAAYLYAPAIHAPMGGHVMSFADRKDGERLIAAQHLQGARWLGYWNALELYKGKP